MFKILKQGFIKLEKKIWQHNTKYFSFCRISPIKWQYVLYIFYIYLYLLKAKNNGAFRNCTLLSLWKMTWGISILHILFLHCLKLLLFLSLIYGYPGVLLTPFHVISTGNSWQKQMFPWALNNFSICFNFQPFAQPIKASSKT